MALVDVRGAIKVAVWCLAVTPPLVAQTVREFQPDTRWSGRAKAVSVHPGNPEAAIVATESGGLFRTWDGGETWFHASGLPMFRMTDVRFGPASPDGTQVVLATGWRDGRRRNGGGIWRSTDAGTTWSQPPVADPATRPGCAALESAWSIAFEPGTSNVYVGTDCGVAVSHDLGATFTHVVPDRYDPAVYSVTAQAGGIVDICRLNGHQRSRNGGATFDPASAGLSSCGSTDTPRSIAASPLEPGVVFAVSGSVAAPGCSGQRSAIFQGVPASDGSVSWRQIGGPICVGILGRSPWVEVHASRNGNPRNYDVYFGDRLNQWRQTCAVGSSCAVSGWSRVSVDHADSAGMAYAATGNCPRYLVSDGGVHRPLDAGDPVTCGGTWVSRPSGLTGLNALQLYEVKGQLDLDRTSLYFGTQDNWLWASGDGGFNWACNDECGGEGFFIHTPRYARSRDASRVVYKNVGRSDVNRQSAPLFTGVTTWRNAPGSVSDPTLVAPGVHVEWAISPLPSGPRYHLMITTTAGRFWNDTGAGLDDPMDVPQAVTAGRDVVIYQTVRLPGGTRDVDVRLGLARITGIRADGTFGTVTAGLTGGMGLNSIGVFPMGEGTFRWPPVFAVDPHDPNHLIAADAGDRLMKVSTTAGETWNPDFRLTQLVTGFDITTGLEEFIFYITPPENPARMPGSTLQAHAIAFDPFRRGRILVGTEAAGIFLSDDGGMSWSAVPSSRQVTGIGMFFFRENSYTDPIDTVYVATYGRGLWTLRLPLGRRRPFELPEEVANVWGGQWIRDRFTGEVIDIDLFRDPDYCPPCRWLAVVGGRLLGGRLGQDGRLATLVVDSPDARLVASSADGQPVALDLGLEQGAAGEIDVCPGCGPLLKAGGSMRGLALLDGEVRAVVAGLGKLPGEDQVGRFSPVIAPVPPASGQMPDGPMLHFAGKEGLGPFAAGEEITVSGTGFCASDKGCSPVVVTVDGKVVTSSAVGANGGFEIHLAAGDHHGLYEVSAEQVDGSGKTISDRQRFIVAVRDGDEEQ